MTAGPARAGQAVARVAVGLAVPTVAYYALRGLGVGVHPALVASAAVSALPAVVSLARHRRVHGLSTYVTVMTLGALAVSLLPGSTRFLLAREAVVTGVTGIWFLAGLWARRPLVYLVSRPLLEGRLRWPPDWEALWAASPRFRRMWRTSSVLWGSALLADAGLRVLLAYTVSPDHVPRPRRGPAPGHGRRPQRGHARLLRGLRRPRPPLAPPAGRGPGPRRPRVRRSPPGGPGR